MSGAQISFDEFKKMDMRVAEVISAEPHANADKLHVLKVRLGDEERQLVAALKQYRTAESLVGLQVVVVVNLEKAKIRGVESEGMLLAAIDGDDLALIIPDKKVTPGSKVM